MNKKKLLLESNRPIKRRSEMLAMADILAARLRLINRLRKFAMNKSKKKKNTSNN